MCLCYVRRKCRFLDKDVCLLPYFYYIFPVNFTRVVNEIIANRNPGHTIRDLHVTGTFLHTFTH